MVDWVHSQEGPVAWFSLDKGDNDPQRFLTYVILGLQNLQDGIGNAALKILQSPDPPPIETFLINLINDLTQYFDKGKYEKPEQVKRWKGSTK